MGIIAFIIAIAFSGLIIGALARLALPGPDPMSIPATIGLGIGGTLVGGLVSRIFFGTGLQFVFAVLGATLLLYLHRRFVQHRPLTKN
jgi:uncharacterized membrane protein YeaQ/YmgE (transglycosylase-associated protein family)